MKHREFIYWIIGLLEDRTYLTESTIKLIKQVAEDTVEEK